MPKNDLESRILKKIQETGFPLELRVSKVLRDSDYYVANNLYYVDRDEGKGRELDIRAHRNFEIPHPNKTYWVRNCLLVECKKSKDPWVVFTSPRTYHDIDTKTLDYQGTQTNDWLTAGLVEWLDGNHPFALYERRGRTSFTPFSNSRTLFKALIGAVKATIASKKEGFSAGYGSVVFYYPLVVLEGELYEAHLNVKNAIDLVKCDSVLFSFSYQSEKYEHERFAVMVLCEKAFPEFLRQLEDTLQYIGPLFEKHKNWFQ